jgi:hypothetical protein
VWLAVVDSVAAVGLDEKGGRLKGKHSVAAHIRSKIIV